MSLQYSETSQRYDGQGGFQLQRNMGSTKKDSAGISWFLYLLECSDGSIYTGIAVDVAARYAAHEKGRGAKYTRSHPPRRLLAVFAYPDRAAASRAEYAMKRLSRLQKRSLCLQRSALWQLPQSAVQGEDGG